MLALWCWANKLCKYQWLHLKGGRNSFMSIKSSMCTQWHLNPSNGIPMTIFYQNSRNWILNLSHLAHSPLDSLYTILSWSSGYLLWYIIDVNILLDFPGGSDDKSVFLYCGRPGFDPWVRKIPLEKEIATHSSTLAWKNPMNGWRSLVGYSSWGRRVKHDWVTWLSYILFTLWRKN